MRDPQRLEAKYTLILQQRAERPDQTVEDFCKSRGINPWTFYYWKKRLEKTSACTTVSKRFIPIHVSSPAPAVELDADSNRPHYCEIRFPNGITMRFSDMLQREELMGAIGAIVAVRS